MHRAQTTAKGGHMIGTQTAQVRRDHEARLVHQAKAGNQDALTELLETHYAAMLSLAIRYTKDPDRARDVLHESCLKVITNLDSFRGSLDLRVDGENCYQFCEPSLSKCEAIRARLDRPSARTVVPSPKP